MYRRFSDDDERYSRKEELTSDDEEELMEYTKALVTTGKHALWHEAKEGMESIIITMEAKEGDKMRYMVNEIEHLLASMGNEWRLKKLRENGYQVFYPHRKRIEHGMTGCY